MVILAASFKSGLHRPCERSVVVIIEVELNLAAFRCRRKQERLVSFAGLDRLHRESFRSLFSRYCAVNEVEHRLCVRILYLYGKFREVSLCQSCAGLDFKDEIAEQMAEFQFHLRVGFVAAADLGKHEVERFLIALVRKVEGDSVIIDLRRVGIVCIEIHVAVHREIYDLLGGDG